MLKKLISTLICPIMLLPIFPLTLPTSAAESTANTPILGKWIWANTVAELGEDGAEIITARCVEEGITDLYLLVKGTGGKLGYLKTQYTDILSRTNRDVLQEMIDSAHKRGIRLHAWICVMRDETYKAAHPEAGLWQYIRGRDNTTITPYDEGYREYIGNVAKELAAYDIDGLHFDYIRYNHNANGWSEKDFENLAAMGANIDRVKELVETTWGYNGRTENSNYLFNAYKNNDPDALLIAKYRRGNIRALAEHIISAARSVKPDLIISSALMPEGAYDSATSELHYGQSYDDAAALYDYVCPMAYSASYGKNESWVTDIAKKAIDKGNKIVMGIQVFDAATSARIMAEMENIRKLMSDPTYGSGMLGAVFFRSGTFEYAKATYDTASKTITVKLENINSSAYTQVRIEGKNGVKFTDAAVGDGINTNAKITLPASGSYVTLKNSNLLGAGKCGYLYLKYNGEIDPAKLPVIIRLYTSSGEGRVYTVVCDTSAPNADMGEPKFPETEESTVEIETTAEPETVTNAESSPETAPVDATEPAPAVKKGCGGFAHSGIAIAAMGAGAVVLKKKKKKNK